MRVWRGSWHLAMALLEQRSDAWFDARKGKLTASNVGASMGLCSWTSRIEAFRRMNGDSEFTGNAATAYGTETESVAVDAYEKHCLGFPERTGERVGLTGFHTHPTQGFIGGSPDGLVCQDGMIEIKCPFWRRRDHPKGWRLHSSIPPSYYLQINTLLEVCDRQWCDFVSYCDDGMYIARVQRDPHLFNTFFPSYYAFWEAGKLGNDKPPKAQFTSKEAHEKVARSIAKSVVSVRTVDFAREGSAGCAALAEAAKMF